MRELSNTELVLGIIGGIAFIVLMWYLIGDLILQRWGIDPEDTELINMVNLACKGLREETITIARRVVFFGRIYYWPYTGTITAKQMDKSWVLKHPAFRSGTLETAFTENAEYLGKYSYQYVPQ